MGEFDKVSDHGSLTSDLLRKDNNKKLEEIEPSPNKCPETSCDNSCSNYFSKIFKLHAAPKSEIETFSGNLLDYHYFIKNFRDQVESCIDSQSGRLNRLIRFTSGEAKELIKHCINLGNDNCYNKALELLNKEYGNRFKISSAFMEELKSWPVIKANDAESFQKFYIFLLKCQTLVDNGELGLLDSPFSIQESQQKLPSAQQERWSRSVELTRRKEKREPTFSDFVEFVEFEKTVVNNSSHARIKSADKKPVAVNTSQIKKLGNQNHETNPSRKMLF